jgi:biopolymer transport protein ExbD
MASRTHYLLELNFLPAFLRTSWIAPNHVLTLRMEKDHSIYWSVGDRIFRKIRHDKLEMLFKEKLLEDPKLVVIVKTDRLAKYNEFVGILDMLNLADVRRYDVRPILETHHELPSDVPPIQE